MNKYVDSAGLWHYADGSDVTPWDNVPWWIWVGGILLIISIGVFVEFFDNRRFK